MLTLAHSFGVVHLCPYFFSYLPTAGTHQSRASTLVHEVCFHALLHEVTSSRLTRLPQASHFTANGGTQDHGYGEGLCQDMARNYPEYAVTNAANHEYFSANARGSNLQDASADQVLVAQAGFGEEYFGY